MMRQVLYGDEDKRVKDINYTSANFTIFRYFSFLSNFET